MAELLDLVLLSPRLPEQKLIAELIYTQTAQIAASLAAGGLVQVVHESIKRFSGSPAIQVTIGNRIIGYVSTSANVITTVGMGGLVASYFRGDPKDYLIDIGVALIGAYMASRRVSGR